MPSCKRASGVACVYADYEALSRAAADLFLRQANEAIKDRGRFSVALSGGRTPQRACELLAGPRFNTLVDWGWGPTAIRPRYSPERRRYWRRIAGLPKFT
jgi:hypothetical protein